MKFPFPLFDSALKGLRTIFFHPMLYSALLFHWAIVNLPSPVKQAEVQEEELPDSVPIASIANLGKVPSEKENSDGTDEKAQEKKEPKPLAEALVKSDPELARQLDEKKRKEEAEEKKRKEEEALRKKAEEEEKKQEESEDKEREDTESEDKEGEGKEGEGKEGEGKEDGDKEGEGKEDGDEEAEPLSRDAYQTYLEFLEKPELFFKLSSIGEFTAKRSDRLEREEDIGEMIFLPTITNPQTAIDLATGKMAAKNVDQEKIVDSMKSFKEYEFEYVKLAPGRGEIFKLTHAEKDTIFVSFIKSKKRGPLRSARLFVEYTKEPQS